MASTARTWFYKEPEHRPYFIEERLHSTFWAARLPQVRFDCVRAEPPFLCRGTWRTLPFEMEWQPRQWLIIRAPQDLPEDMLLGFSRVLGFKPAFRYEDPQGRMVYEWHLDGGKARWSAIQGVPIYKRPERLN